MADTNTKAVLVGLDELALQLVTGMKDGLVGEFEDFFTRFTTDAAFKAKLLTAWNDLKAAQGELSSLGYLDLLDLAQLEVSYVPKFLAALHTVPAPTT